MRSGQPVNPLRGGEPSIARMRTCVFQSAEGCWPSGGGRRLIEASTGRIRIARCRPRCLDHRFDSSAGRKRQPTSRPFGQDAAPFDWLASHSASLRLAWNRSCCSCPFLISSPKGPRGCLPRNRRPRCPLADRFPVRSTYSSATVRRVLTRPNAFQLSASR